MDEQAYLERRIAQEVAAAEASADPRAAAIHRALAAAYEVGLMPVLGRRRAA